MRIWVVVQARMGSTRLPGKVLADLAGEPMLSRVVARAARAREVDGVAVATSAGARDDAIEALCAERGIALYRGSETDVLERYARAAAVLAADAVARVTADCPLVEPDVIDRIARAFRAGQPNVAYASNVWPTRTYPRGLDVEVVRSDALEIARLSTDRPSDREHVTPFIQRHPDTFPRVCVTGDEDLSDHRWTVDTPDDLRLVRTIYEHFGHDRFSWRDVLGAFAEHPEWREINRHVVQKEV